MSEPSNAKYDDETARLSAAGLLTARRRIACPPCPQGLALHRSQGGRALYPSIPSMSHFPVAYQMVSPYVMFGGYCAAACSFSLSSLSTPSAPLPSTLLYTTKQPSETIAIVLKNIELENGKCGLQRSRVREYVTAPETGSESSCTAGYKYFAHPVSIPTGVWSSRDED
ncbi:hypothetical protein ECG_03602 [Echinococcus granulosus]|uniref:Expressed conserved protein n=1 Tax=Echinococcus granulosus TaxID=6210 RepID=A0A068X0K5_ECHGR|nr:hypothetical protein ECG_03602 [Echinococcus granulosus]CDS23439.1 hypothetical protein EgrG_002041300 [Echinococcus granulosus]